MWPIEEGWGRGGSGLETDCPSTEHEEGKAGYDQELDCTRPVNAERVLYVFHS